MTVSLKHKFNLAKSDGVDATAVKPSNWNDEHDLTAVAGKVLGTPIGSTAVSELPIEVDSTGQSLRLPSGNTAARPASPLLGMLRLNTTLSRIEGYLNSVWTAIGRGCVVASSAPSDNYSGDLFFDTDTNVLQVHNGTSFLDISPGDGLVTLAKLAAAVQQSLSPAGSILAYGGAAAPTGWELCHGQAISRTTFAALFAAIGTTYGAGNGSTTFNVPDLRGRVIAGQDDMGGTSANRLTGLSGGVDGDVLGAAGGAESHVLTEAQLADHGHPFRLSVAASGSSDASTTTTGGLVMRTNNVSTEDAFNGVPSNTTGEQIGGTGSGAAHNNVQPTLIMNYIIKT